MPKGKCVFRNIWMQDKKFKDWLSPDATSISHAFCESCKKTINVASMGEAALLVHLKSKTHEKNHNDMMETRRKNLSITGFFSQSATDDKMEPTSSTSSSLPSSASSFIPSTASSSSASTQIKPFLLAPDALKAEIIWCLKMTTSHFSSSSCADIVDIWKVKHTLIIIFF